MKPAQRPRIGVAVSGGRDSVALWHATARAARDSALEVVALHVHHGLQPQAGNWVAQLQGQARRWRAGGLPVRVCWQRLRGAPGRGDSIEAWARRERYAALAAMARDEGLGIVLLAHHRRDQAETFLLQALRGGGAAGLAAMPRAAERDGIVWSRPWLDQPRSAIEAYVQRHRLRYIDDPSNTDHSLSRNRLRHEVWPALSGAFEQAESSLAASARRSQEAAACLRELAQIDASALCSVDGRLQLAGWLELSAPRRANLLRAWLSAQAPAGVPESLVQRLLRELPVAPSASAWPWPEGELRLHAAHLQIVPRRAAAGAAPPRLVIDLSREGRVAVPAWCGSFEVTAVDAAGVEALRLRCCELRTRCGGERFQRASGTPPRALKKQFQAAGVPAWQRDGPLLYGAQQLLFVPGLGIDARAHAPRGAPMLGLRWLPDR